MTDEEKRIAIAEACGWHDIRYYPANDLLLGRGPKDPHTKDVVPDYLNDLSAMHEAEKVMTDEQWELYADHLEQIKNPVRKWIHATAAQRANALLKAIGEL